MNRSIKLWIVAAVAAFGLVACSGASGPPADAPAPAPATQEVVPEESAEVSEPAGEPPATEPSALDAATIQACTDMAGPFAEANEGMAAIAGDSETTPQEVVDMWTHLVDALGTISETATDDAVKTAASTAHADFTDLRDAMQKTYVDGDMSAMGDYATAAQAIQGSYGDLLALCGPEATS